MKRRVPDGAGGGTPSAASAAAATAEGARDLKRARDAAYEGAGATNGAGAGGGAGGGAGAMPCSTPSSSSSSSSSSSPAAALPPSSPSPDAKRVPSATSYTSEQYRAKIQQIYRDFVSSALECVSISMLTDPLNLESGATFAPEYAHQVFGEGETIVGYASLAIRVCYTADTLHTVVVSSFRARLHEQARPDNYVKMLVDNALPPDTCGDNVMQFFNIGMAADGSGPRFVPFGKRHGSWVDSKAPADEVGRASFELYVTSLDTPAKRAYHQRVESLATWFIDGASAIDVEDPRWVVITVYRKLLAPPKAASYELAGYITLHIFTQPFRAVQPQSVRICQALVLPHMQHRGLGSAMVGAAYDLALQRNMYEVTVEDPAPAFVKLRDVVDFRRCHEAKAFGSSAATNSPPLSEQQLNAARLIVPLTRYQLVRCHEAEVFSATDTTDMEAYRRFRLRVKRRLYAQDKATLSKLPPNVRKQRLASAYSVVEERIRLMLRKAGVSEPPSVSVTTGLATTTPLVSSSSSSSGSNSSAATPLVATPPLVSASIDPAAITDGSGGNSPPASPASTASTASTASHDHDDEDEDDD